MTTTSRFLGLELDRRGIALLVGAGGTLAVAVIAFQITIPQYTKIQDLEGQIAAKTQEVSTKQQQLAQLPELTAQRQRSAQLLASVTSLIPTADKLPSLLIDTTRMVQASNADLRKFTPGDLKAIPELAGVANISSTSAKVSLNATFAEALALLRNVERLEQLLRIENVTLKPVDAKASAPGGSPNQRLVAEFELTAYVQGSPPADPVPATSTSPQAAPATPAPAK